VYVLYGGLFTRGLLVEMVLAEGDLAYELRAVDILVPAISGRGSLARIGASSRGRPRLTS
jgi:hypothetical protein